MDEALPTRQTKPVFDAYAGDFFLLSLKNLVLTVLSIGIYRFWAKTEVRRYLLGHTQLWDDRFEYTGTGKELFVSFLRALPILVLLFGIPILAVVFISNQAARSIALFLWYLLFFFLGYVGFYAAFRYRLSRINLRGIRFSLAGSSVDYGKLGVRVLVLSALTLGLYWPFGFAALVRAMVNQMGFGTERFDFKGNGREILVSFLLCLLLFLPTLGLSFVWFGARQTMFAVNNTSLGHISFKLAIRKGEWYGLVLSNFLMILVTLGIAAPLAVLRTIRFFAERLTIVGEPDFVALGQAPQSPTRMGEGLFEALEAGWCSQFLQTSPRIITMVLTQAARRCA